MVIDVLGAELNDVRIPVRAIRLDLVQDVERTGVLRVGFEPVAVVDGGITLLDEKVRFEEPVARIGRRPGSGHAAKAERYQKAQQEGLLHRARLYRKAFKFAMV